MKSLRLVGGGVHAHACIDVVEAEGAFTIQGIVERTEGNHAPVLAHSYIGNDGDLARLLATAPSALVMAGQVKTGVDRVALYARLVELGANMPIVISPMIYVSRHPSVDDGTTITHGGIINVIASIAHHCHISTGARVNIGSGTFIGGGAVPREGVRVGANCVVRAGAIALHDLPDSSKYLGMP